MKDVKKQIHKGEKTLIGMGCYVVNPINLSIVLTPNEQAILNVIRHCQNLGERYISNSVMRVNTGLSENTVRKARDVLIKLDIIELVGNPTRIGIEYKINYKTLCTITEQLNSIKNPIKRLIHADKFRGEKLARHTKTIEEFQNSELGIKFIN